MPTSVPPRGQVAAKYKWNAESVFPSAEAWSMEVESILAEIPRLTSYRGRLAESPQALLEALQRNDDLMRRASVAGVYAGFSHAVDSTNEHASGMVSRAQSVQAQVTAGAAFIQPEIIAMGQPQIEAWIAATRELAIYSHFFQDLFRKQGHVRSSEVEEVMGLAGEPLEAASNGTTALTTADFKFAPARDSRGRRVPVLQGNLQGELLHSPDRKLRQTAWQSYMDQHWEYRHTLASNLASSLKANVFRMRVRGHSSSLAAALFELNIPTEVFHNLIGTFRRRLPTWHRYYEIRRRALGLKKLGFFDLWAPLSARKPKIAYERAVELICEGLAPMGTEYVEVVRRGCLEERWVDVYPNVGKGTGAFSWGAPGTHPFIKMNYADGMVSMSTLAHELGHSMHSYLTWKNQPQIYTDYSLFVAEVASNFHQALVRAHLLATVPDKHFQLAVLEEAMSNFQRYFLIMPTLARFELETHERTERGDPVTAESMSELLVNLVAEAFGPALAIDRRRVGMIWSTFGHLFADYYVYAYATGIAGAHALAARVVRGESQAIEQYLAFLKAGASDYSLNVLRMAGVDLATPGPVEAAFAVMENYIDRMEQLLGALRPHARRG